MVGLGDKVKLLTSRTSSTGALFLRPSFFTVSGICSTGYYELDGPYPLRALQPG